MGEKFFFVLVVVAVVGGWAIAVLLPAFPRSVAMAMTARWNCLVQFMVDVNEGIANIILRTLGRLIKR